MSALPKTDVPAHASIGRAASATRLPCAFWTCARRSCSFQTVCTIHDPWALYWTVGTFTVLPCSSLVTIISAVSVQLNKLKLRKMLWVNCRGLPLGWRGSHYLHADRSALSLATCRTERENVTQVKRAFSIESLRSTGSANMCFIESKNARTGMQTSLVTSTRHPWPWIRDWVGSPDYINPLLTILPSRFFVPPPPPPPLSSFSPLGSLCVSLSPCFAPSCESLGGERFYTRLCGARGHRAFVITCDH